ncbi:hypothetical protein ACFOET_05145 [Parapedobacter deserti]|uniref:Uncharacterized protein n=1 Tax=Parapedobacter deserti TaxID=1912957 RepID=A0ABV7JFZ3_9SPHI
MKRHYITIALCAMLFSCNQTSTRNQGQETAQNDRMQTTNHEQKNCFLRLDGTAQQDSSFIQLVIRDETVSGIYNVIPQKKDARRGTVLGTLDNGVLDLVWTFAQEGMQDTLRVVFALRNGKLIQKPFVVDPLTGRQLTVDTSSFSVVYEPIDCVTMNGGDYAGSR